ncbi:rcc1/blip-II [Sanghuangporus baumii]|uniref:Rcc1/blip-II n=1 Tax=Sanghuangporus baumii TaxID=108892 RepID=A0A9Q5HY12_SANBA|nr:rcc1/blip-II [Sanghuangporus baumii]
MSESLRCRCRELSGYVCFAGLSAENYVSTHIIPAIRIYYQIIELLNVSAFRIDTQQLVLRSSSGVLLPIHDLLALGATNRYYSAVCDDETLWKMKCKEDFGFSDSNLARTRGWKFVHKDLRNTKVFVWGGFSALGFGIPPQWSSRKTRPENGIPRPVQVDFPKNTAIVDLVEGESSFHALVSWVWVYVWATLSAALSVHIFSGFYARDARLTSKLSGPEYVAKLRNGHPEIFKSAIGMQKHVFDKLLDVLERRGGLRSSKYMCTDEKLAIFLSMATTGMTNREAQNRFQRSADTISKTVHKIIDILVSPVIYNAYVKLPRDYDDTPPEIKDNKKLYPYLRDCLGALDCTHIHAHVLAEDRPRYRNRKGFISQNRCSALASPVPGHSYYGSPLLQIPYPFTAYPSEDQGILIPHSRGHTSTYLWILAYASPCGTLQEPRRVRRWLPGTHTHPPKAPTQHQTL